MPDGLTLRTRGIAETKAALTNFVGDLRKTVRGSLRSAARPMRLAAQANAPVLKKATRRRVPGTLRRNIKIFNSRRANGQGGVIGVYLSVKASRKDLKRAPISGDPYYYRWVESGHRIVSRSGAATGSVPGAQYFLRAFRSHGQGTIDRFSPEVLARVARFNRTK